MQCNCGGSTKVELKFKVVKKRPVMRLELDVCQGCGRVGRQRLYRVVDAYTSILVARKE